MKKIYLSFVISFMLLIVPAPVWADANDDFMKTLHDGTIAKVYSILTVNISEAKKAIDEKAKTITATIKNYRSKYQTDISAVVTQYRKNYVNTKTTALENMKNDFIDSMEKEKPGIISDMEKQIQQSIDSDYQKALKKMEEDLK